MICDIFLPIMPASCRYILHWGEKYNLAQILRIGQRGTILYIYCALENKYNLAQILRIYWALEKSVQSCANLAHMLRIGKEVQSCANLAHILCIGRESCPNLAHYTSNVQLAHLTQNTISL